MMPYETLITTDTNEDAISIYPLTTSELEGFIANAESLVEGWIRTSRFEAAAKDICFLPKADGGLHCILLGLGKTAPKPNDPWWLAGLVPHLESGAYAIKSKTLADDVLAAGAFGWAMAHYKFSRYKSNIKTKPAKLHLPETVDIKLIQSEIKATCLVRDMVNTPCEDMGPADIETIAQKLADTHAADMTVIAGDDLLQQNFPTIHMVGRAAATAPRLIDLSWGKKDNPKITLVGKGVCFDSGGLDIKSSAFMRNMKKDMGGAAHVLGLAQIIMEQNLPVKLRVLIPAVENAISGNAFRPGDIIKTRKGITVEIGNTDAEGRLVLCDALALADEEEPEIIIDFATLTGAARVALGPDLPALFSNHAQWPSDIIEHGMATGDPLWHMPLWQEYAADLESNVADICNVSSGSYGGAITAALYLEKFIEKCPRWVHIDTYAWRDSSKDGRPKGGEALGVRAMFYAIKAIVEQKAL